MGISKKNIVTAILEIIGGKSLKRTFEAAVGVVKAKGKNNYIHLQVKRGSPLDQGEESFERDFIGAGGFLWDVCMAPSGTWNKRFSGGGGIIVTVALWIKGPLCETCETSAFKKKTKGRWPFKKMVLICRRCNQSKQFKNSKTAKELGGQVKRRLVQSLKV